MSIRMFQRGVFLLVVGAIQPWQLLAAQTTGQPKAPPVYEGNTLRSTTDNLYNKKLTPTAEEMRSDIMLVRDSLDLVASLAERLKRSAGRTESVMLSAAKSLIPACQAAQRAVNSVKPRIAGIHLSVPDKKQQMRSEGILRDYRVSLSKVGKDMGTCEQEISAALRSKTPDAVLLGKLGSDVGQEVLDYEGHLRIALVHFDIPLRPKGSTPR